MHWNLIEVFLFFTARYRQTKHATKTRAAGLSGPFCSFCPSCLLLCCCWCCSCFNPFTHQKYYITQYGELSFSQLIQMKDDYTTNSHYLTYTFLFRKVGRMYSLNLGVKGLICCYRNYRLIADKPATELGTELLSCLSLRLVATVAVVVAATERIVVVVVV